MFFNWRINWCIAMFNYGYDFPRLEMHITKREQIPTICKWYFENVEERSIGSRMYTYFQQNNMIRNGIQIDANSLSGHMRKYPDVFQKYGKQKGRIIWGLRRSG